VNEPDDTLVVVRYFVVAPGGRGGGVDDESEYGKLKGAPYYS
jgi:hypothetical protein